jgi:hypothetical protein
MRKLSKLAALPLPDQNLVIDLCSKHPYDDVVTLVAKPRSEGGLDLKTSRSALCRFASTFHPDPDRLDQEVKRLIPLLETADSSKVPAAIRFLVQQQVFRHLHAGAPFKEIERPLHWLFNVWQQAGIVPASHNSSCASHNPDTIKAP